MKKYEQYKDSGVQWIGQIPSHWTIIPMKRLFSFGKGLSITKSDLTEKGQAVISYGQVHSKKNTGTKTESHLLRYVPESFTKGNESSAVSFGDFIFADTSEDLAGCGNCVYIDKDGIYAGYHSLIAKGEGRDNKYFAYLFLTDAWRYQLRSMVGGVKVFSITQSILSATTLLVPSLEEQRVIAAYLDHKVGQIDAVIAEKEAMVSDLTAYRSAVISEAVTRGLDKSAPMRDSGIDWIGQIPEHWQCAPFKYFLSQPLQYGANEPAEADNREWPRYIRITDINEVGTLKDETFKSLKPEKAKDYLLEKGDILFARSGATVGKTYLFDEDYEACFAGYLIKAKCSKLLNPRYAYLYTYSNQYENWKNSVFIQATIQNIGADKYSTMPIVVPPIAEQTAIVEHLNGKLQQIDTSITELNSQIADLQSYKSAIITEAVTGKVDLRDWNPQTVTA